MNFRVFSGMRVVSICGDNNDASPFLNAGSLDFMRSRQNLKKAIKCEQSKRKGYSQKPKTYHYLSKIPNHLTITADGKPFLILIPE